MNPYDFVRIDWQRPGPRRPAPRQDQFQGMSGRLQGTITALTPLFIAGDHRSEPKTFKRDQHRRYVIPGTSLKGLMRNLVETIDAGAWWFFGRDGQWSDREAQGGSVNYRAQLPQQFRRPTTRHQLDAACRMFGFLGDNDVSAGSVGFEDAICEDAVSHAAIYTCILSLPKPRHRAWYLDDEQQHVRGRKFYFHALHLQTAPGWLPYRDVAPNQRQNAYIQPLDHGSVFTFGVHFTNVAPDDFALLLYAITLEPSMRHKLGYGKPAGLGSVEFAVQALEIIDYQARYRQANRGITRYEGDALASFIRETTALYVDNHASITLQDLRRIWQWPPLHDLRYPDRNWFQANPIAPLIETP